jgi:hypothetical protein
MWQGVAWSLWLLITIYMVKSMATEDDESWVIESIKNDGQKFRPSDWIERISASLGSFKSDHRLHYSNEVQPCIIEGRKCLLVSKGLAKKNPEAYTYIMHFAEVNNLKVQEDRRKASER